MVSIVNKTKGVDSVAGSSAVTASVTPGADKLMLLTVGQRIDSGTPNEPTVTGNGLTWVAIDTKVYDDSGSQRRVTLFRAMGPSPSAGAITIDFASQSQSHIVWILDEVSGMDTSGTNGSGAIVQFANNGTLGVGANDLTATLSAFGSINNATFGAISIDGDESNKIVDPGSGFTAVAQQGNTGTNISINTQFRAHNDTTVDMYVDVGSEIGIIAIEIKSSGAGLSFLDSYDVSNADTNWYGLPGDTQRAGQSFDAPETIPLTVARFALVTAYGNEGGTCVAKLYAHTGTFGTDGTPTGSPLATSDSVNLSTIEGMGGGWEGAVASWLSTANESDCIEFIFSTPYELQAGTKYFIVLEYTVDNYLLMLRDATSPSHGGNASKWNGSSWDLISDGDFIFYLYGETPEVSGNSNFFQFF